jgi:hypothetical protein
MRTAPKSGHVLSCEYDDGHGLVEREETSPQSEAEAESEAAKKKKRKSSGEPRKKKKDVEDEQTEMLRKKIGA